MALSLRKNGSRSPVGLDVDGAFLAAVQLDGGRVTRAASAELEASVVRDGEVADPDRLAAALKDFFTRNELPKNVRLGISNQQIVVRQIELPRIDDGEQRDAAVRFQAAEAIAMPLDEAVLDYQLCGETTGPDGSRRMQVVVVAARRSMVDSLVDAVRDAGLKPAGIDLDAFALVRALAQPSVSDDSARVFCHLGGVTNLAIAVGTSCLFTRPLTAAWDSDAEGAASALADEIRLSIDSYMGQPDARPVSDVVLSGPGSARSGFAEELGQLTRMPVTVAKPLGSLDVSGVPAGEDPHRHTVAAGLAMGAAA